METHPVPKNVLTVEFKLFGPLTIKQFVRILISCLLGLGIFIISPESLRLLMVPVIAVIVGIGVLTALVEGFEIKVMGMIKAIFSSTQYVWQKQSDVPDVLQQEKKKVVTSDNRTKLQSVETSLDDLSIENILDARRQATTVDLTQETAGQSAAVTNNPIEYTANGGDDYFNKIYQDVFQTQTLDRSLDTRSSVDTKSPVQVSEGLAGENRDHTINVGENLHVSNNPVRNDQPRPNISADVAAEIDAKHPDIDEEQLSPVEKQNRIKDLTGKINELRSQLKSNDPNVRRQVTQNIKAVFDEIQELAGKHSHQEQVLSQSQAMFGVVVNKQNEPVPAARVGLFALNDSEKVLLSSESATDGRFTFDLEGLPKDAYMVKVSHPQFEFPIFRVDLNVESLPGFKFKAN